MKTNPLFICLLFILSFSNTFAQNDSLIKVKSKRFFIGFNAGIGLGWRNYKDINDTMYFNQVQPNNEKPNLANNFSINIGFNNKNVIWSLGIDYSSSKYQNKNANTDFYIYEKTYPYNLYDTVSVYYSYSYKHKIISLPLNILYKFEKEKSWFIGLGLKINWMYDYELTSEYTDESYSFLSNYFGGGFRTQKVTNDLISNYLFGSVNAIIAKTILETNNWSIMSFINIEYSTQIGRKPKILGTPYESKYYETRPLHLLLPTCGFNINLKL